MVSSVALTLLNAHSDAIGYTRAMLDQRARLLRAAVGFALVPPEHPELQVLHRWLAERGEERARERVQALRARYEIQYDIPAEGP